MKVKFLLSTISTAALSIGLAYALPPKPAKCPEPTAIQSISFDEVAQDKDGTWAAGVMNNQYGTKESWTFVIGKINAANEKDARANATEGMKSLKLFQGPIALEQYGMWACLYTNSKNYPAVTVTPSLGGLNAAKQLIK